MVGRFKCCFRYYVMLLCLSLEDKYLGDIFFWKTTPCHLNQNALTFSLKHQGVFKKLQVLFFKPLDVFVWSSSKTRVGHASRVMNFMLEDERSSYYICSILFHVQNFRNFKLLESEWLACEIPLWTSFLFVIVILHAFSCPDCTLWYYRLSGDGTSSGNFILINLIYNKSEVPEEDFRVLFFPIIYNNKV